MNCCNNFLYKTQKGREIKEKLKLSKMNHILKFSWIYDACARSREYVIYKIFRKING